MMNVILSSRCKYLILALNTTKGSQHSRSVLLYHPQKLKTECKGLSFQRNSGPKLVVVMGWW